MSNHVTLEALDADGAIQEAAHAVDPDDAATRADFFKKAAIGGGALVAGASSSAACPRSRWAPRRRSRTSRSSTTP